MQKIYALASNELCNLRLAPVAELLGRLVADAGQRLLPPQHGHDVENRRRDGAAGEGGAQGLCNFSELLPGGLGKSADCGLQRRDLPVGRRLELRQRLGEGRAGLRIEQLGGLVVERDRPLRREVGRTLDQVEQGLGPLLQRGQGGGEPVPAGLLELGGNLGAVVEVGQQLPDAVV